MEEFKTLEQATALFQNRPSFGVDNCFFICFVTTPNSRGGMLAGMKMQELNKCDGYLVNQSERGIGLIPLHRTCKLLTYDIEKMTADTNDFRFMPPESIQKITVKNENWISLVSKVITIKLTNGVRYDWRAGKKEKKIPYHESGFAKFMDNVKNKR